MIARRGLPLSQGRMKGSISNSYERSLLTHGLGRQKKVYKSYTLFTLNPEPQNSPKPRTKQQQVLFQGEGRVPLTTRRIPEGVERGLGAS